MDKFVMLAAGDGNPFDPPVLPREPLPGGVEVAAPALPTQHLFLFDGLAGHAGPTREESAVTICGTLDGRPAELNLSALDFANVALTGVEALARLGFIRFHALWAAARRVHPDPGLRTEPVPADERGGGI